MSRVYIKPYRGLESRISLAEPKSGELMITTDTRRVFLAEDATSISEISYLSSLNNTFDVFETKSDVKNDDIILIEDSEDGYIKKKATLKSIQTGVEWNEIGGDQTDVSLSGFTNDIGYITIDDVVPDGDAGDVQFNEDGQFKGTSEFKWDDIEKTLNITGTVSATEFSGIGAQLTGLLGWEVYLDSTGFSGILSENDYTVQLALETIDSYIPNLSLNTTDELPEGETHLYNQIGDIDVSMYDSRIDMGPNSLGTNPSGYYKDLITNKKIVHSNIGTNDTEMDGGLGYDDGRPYYWKYSRKQDVLIGIDIQESENSSISYHPFESGYVYFIHSGDSHEQGFNNVSLVQSYINSSMGAFPSLEIIDGGTF
jgi:hypothetical protein